jgi:hypothetical protein
MNCHLRFAYILALAAVSAAPSFAQIVTNAPQSSPAPSPKAQGQIAAIFDAASTQASQSASVLSQQFLSAGAALKSRYDLQVLTAKLPGQAEAARQQQMKEYIALREGYEKRMGAVQQQLLEEKKKALAFLQAQSSGAQQSGSSSGDYVSTVSAWMQDVAAAFDNLQNSVQVEKAKVVAQSMAYAS